MKIVFVGWNENGEKCLAKLLKSKMGPRSVLVPEDYDTEKMKEICKKHRIKCVEVGSDLKELASEIKVVEPDLLIIASFPRLIPTEILDAPKFGSINVHAAALPKNRGYHPINWSIIRDERITGVTVHYLNAGMDSGNILAQKTIPIKNSDDVNTIRKKLTTLGADLLARVVEKIQRSESKIKGQAQNDSLATYALKRKPEDGRINWSQTSRETFNLIRALKSPYPNAFSYNSEKEKIEFRKSFLGKTPGEVLAKIKGYYLVSTGDGVVLVKPKNKLAVGETLT